ncbi:MAG: beta-L-arabinofuranosidase domain-containing protein [Pirellulaceae bacterium]
MFGKEIESRGTLVLDRVPKPKLLLTGPVGMRVKNNIDHWVKMAPKNNPGLLDMFARRDDGGQPDLVPWAGEFVGKYLIAGVQAMRMSDDPELKKALQSVVDRLLQLQADDGYLGPWPQHERLRGHWDLWGHYHIMLGLMLWHEHTGDPRADAAAQRIADLICDTCLDTDFRVIDAGSHEMNMSVIHGMARLHRKTGNPRYLRMAQEILRDFEKAGDYYRTGLDGKEFFRSPRPRWESLHALQGLVELYRITGDDTYRTAFLHHWASMRRFDYRNTGGFSSSERATGNPYKDDAIETCCVVAFEEVMIDALRLSGQSTIADDLEQTTFNAMLGAQHPSGAWCTYNTPMAGERIPSHIHIRFQAREDTPHLNCCSVNGPRGYGSISQWGVMRSQQGLTLNYYGPMTARVSLTDGTPVTISEETTYPLGATVNVKVDVDQPKRFKLALRIPAWSADTKVSACGKALPGALPGEYLVLDRLWEAGDVVILQFDMSVRYVPGDLDQFGKVSLYRGPILLALDNRFKTDAQERIDLSKLSQSRILRRDEREGHGAEARHPWMFVDVPAADGKVLRMIEFANAGATTIEGQPISSYATWIRADGARPPSPVAWYPSDRSKVGPGAIRFVWRRPAAEATDRMHTVVIADRPDFEEVVLRSRAVAGRWMLLPAEQAEKLQPHTPYYWKVVARNSNGQAESIPPFKQFVVDPAAPPLVGNWPYGQRETDQMVTEARLQGDLQPAYGELLQATGWKPGPGPTGKPNGAIELSGKDSMIKYKVLTFPEEDYTVSVKFSMTETPSTPIGQVFSAWAGGMDDPLRLVVQEGRLYARMEAGSGYGTEGYPIEKDRWYHVVGVKQGTTLTLYVDGQVRSTSNAPPIVVSNAADFAIGGNPNFSGAEFLPARFADLRFYARALSQKEVRELDSN